MIRFSTLLLALSIGLSATRADDLDVMVDETLSVETRAEAQARLAAAEFRPIMARLSELICSHRVVSRLPSGMGSHCDTPEKLNERERIGCKLNQLYRQHMAAAKERGDDLELMLGLLEDPWVGLGKSLVVWGISTRLQIATENRQTLVPPVPEVLQRLDRFVQDGRELDQHRRVIIDALLQNADQNKYLELALDLSSAGETARRQLEYFDFCTRACKPGKLSPENRRKYLRYAFSLLEKIDDGQSGRGEALARQIAHFIGQLPIRDRYGGSAPDPLLQAYWGLPRLDKNPRQDTINDVRRWWDANKAAL